MALPMIELMTSMVMALRPIRRGVIIHRLWY
jgi:hypothetical protein